MRVQELRLLLERPVAFYPVFARVGGGVTAGVFLSQLWYWSNRVAVERDGWLYKTQEEWNIETCLSRSEQETARKRLREIGVLQEKREGLPAKLFYRLDVDRLIALLSAMIEPNDESTPPVQDSGDEVDESFWGVPPEPHEPPAEARYPARFTPPTHEIVAAYFSEQGSTAEEGASFYDYQVSKGWKVGTAPMRDWQAAARNWIRRAASYQSPQRNGTTNQRPGDGLGTAARTNALFERFAQEQGGAT